MNYTFRVTKNDIKGGERSNPSNCAIARSIKRNKKLNVKSVSVFHNVCVIKTNSKSGKIQSYVAGLNQKAQTFVRNFDHKLRVSPLSVNFNFVKTSSTRAAMLAYNGCQE